MSDLATLLETPLNQDCSYCVEKTLCNLQQLIMGASLHMHNSKQATLYLNQRYQNIVSTHTNVMILQRNGAEVRLGAKYSLDKEEIEQRNVFIIECNAEKFAKMRILSDQDLTSGHEVTLLCYKALKDGFVFLLEMHDSSTTINFMVKMSIEETNGLANLKGKHSLLKDSSKLYFLETCALDEGYCPHFKFEVHTW